MRIAIQGEAGSFHDAAAQIWAKQINSNHSIVPAATFADTFKLVTGGQADIALVAIENSLYGSINQVYDLIEKYGYPIIGEIHLPIHHQLISLGQPETITDIYSHPVALAQCEAYLDEHFPSAERHEYHDTAAAVEYIKQLTGADEDNHQNENKNEIEAKFNHSHQVAAIASTTAAQMHNMPIVAHDIEDDKANFTRFLVLQPGGQAPKDANRSSIVLTTNHTPGALAQILTIFAKNHINLSKLQSRPIIGSPWKYKFYLVVDSAGQPLHNALEQIKPLTASLTLLGEYIHKFSTD